MKGIDNYGLGLLEVEHNIGSIAAYAAANVTIPFGKTFDKVPYCWIEIGGGTYGAGVMINVLSVAKNSAVVSYYNARNGVVSDYNVRLLVAERK